MKIYIRGIFETMGIKIAVLEGSPATIVYEGNEIRFSSALAGAINQETISTISAIKTFDIPKEQLF